MVSKTPVFDFYYYFYTVKPKNTMRDERNA